MLGKYNTIIDELGHVLLAFAIVYSFYSIEKLSFTHGFFVFTVSILIDVDHLFNPIIGKIFNLKASVIPSKIQNGVTIKILHGVDLYFIYSLISYSLTGNLYFGIALFVSLVAHHLWDFVVYDHTWKELFLITRALCKFKPGKRKTHTGLIFDSSTLPM